MRIVSLWSTATRYWFKTVQRQIGEPSICSNLSIRINSEQNIAQAHTHNLPKEGEEDCTTIIINSTEKDNNHDLQMAFG